MLALLLVVSFKIIAQTPWLSRMVFAEPGAKQSRRAADRSDALKSKPL
jgi:hypothetical protein